mmetsp:Transcript_40345/g.96821  ORF Transcript_40345/g.96821 Transcript_40345/m.96821 type:complete len:242 (-) Transcript_40345:520-1245(-)
MGWVTPMVSSATMPSPMYDTSIRTWIEVSLLRSTPLHASRIPSSGNSAPRMPIFNSLVATGFLTYGRWLTPSRTALRRKWMSEEWAAIARWVETPYPLSFHPLGGAMSATLVIRSTAVFSCSLGTTRSEDSGRESSRSSSCSRIISGETMSSITNSTPPAGRPAGLVKEYAVTSLLLGSRRWIRQLPTSTSCSRSTRKTVTTRNSSSLTMWHPADSGMRTFSTPASSESVAVYGPISSASV